MRGKRLAGITTAGSCLCLIYVLAYAYVLILPAAQGHVHRAEVSAHKNNQRPSFAKAVMRVRYREDENQGERPQQRKPFPILCVMALNQRVKETDAKRERSVDGRPSGGGFLQPCLPEFYHRPLSSFMFPPNVISVCSLLLEKVSAASPPTQVALTPRGFNGKKRTCLFLST